MTDARSRRTIHTQQPIFECGSVIELPPRPGHSHGRFACVMRKVNGDDAWKMALVDVAKARLIEGSEMELSGSYLKNAKLAYSSHVWQERCIAARAEEHKRMRSLADLAMGVAHG